MNSHEVEAQLQLARQGMKKVQDKVIESLTAQNRKEAEALLGEARRLYSAKCRWEAGECRRGAKTLLAESRELAFRLGAQAELAVITAAAAIKHAEIRLEEWDPGQWWPGGTMHVPMSEFLEE